MKLFLSVFVAMISLQAVASQELIFCSRGELGQDDYRQFILSEDGSVSISYYETHFEIKKELVTIVDASAAEGQESTAKMILATKANYTIQGEDATDTASLAFVYNPQQKAGRLTFIADDERDLSRNELYTKCSNKIPY